MNARSVLPDFDWVQLDEAAHIEDFRPNRRMRRASINTNPTDPAKRLDVQVARQERRLARAILARLQPPTMLVPRTR